MVSFCFQAEDGIRDLVRSRGLGDVYKRQGSIIEPGKSSASLLVKKIKGESGDRMPAGGRPALSLIHI